MQKFALPNNPNQTMDVLYTGQSSLKSGCVKHTYETLPGIIYRPLQCYVAHSDTAWSNSLMKNECSLSIIRRTVHSFGLNAGTGSATLFLRDKCNTGVSEFLCSSKNIYTNFHPFSIQNSETPSQIQNLHQPLTIMSRKRRIGEISDDLGSTIIKQTRVEQPKRFNPADESAKRIFQTLDTLSSNGQLYGMVPELNSMIAEYATDSVFCDEIDCDGIMRKDDSKDEDGWLRCASCHVQKFHYCCESCEYWKLTRKPGILFECDECEGTIRDDCFNVCRGCGEGFGFKCILSGAPCSNKDCTTIYCGACADKRLYQIGCEDCNDDLGKQSIGE